MSLMSAVSKTLELQKGSVLSLVPKRETAQGILGSREDQSHLLTEG